MYKKKHDQPYYKNRHSCFLLQYHMVLVTKYRHPVLTGPVKDIVYDTVRQIMDEKGFTLLEINGEPDHVHILFEADPFTPPGELANIIKTKTSRFARKQYGNTLLRKYYWKPLFWSDSYFVTTVSENTLSVVRAYIQNQQTTGRKD
jgi:putative transposase